MYETVTQTMENLRHLFAKDRIRLRKMDEIRKEETARLTEWNKTHEPVALLGDPWAPSVPKKAWSSDEKTLLLEERAAGAPFMRIAALMERTENSVKSQWHTLTKGVTNG